MRGKVVAYVRFNSIAGGYNNQMAGIINYIKSNNLILKHIYSDENCSGRNTDRPAFQQMILDIDRDNDIEAVIVYEMSRFSRNLEDISHYLQEFKAKNIDFISVTEQLFQFHSDGNMMSSFIENLIGILADLQSEPTRVTSVSNISRKRDKVPFGYELDAKGSIKVKENEAMMVREIFRLFLKYQSCKKVGDEINKMFPDNERKFRTSQINSMLRNVFYAGHKVYTEVANNRNEMKQTVIPFNHFGIVPSEIWEEVQIHLKNKGAIVTKNI